MYDLHLVFFFSSFMAFRSSVELVVSRLYEFISKNVSVWSYVIWLVIDYIISEHRKQIFIRTGFLRHTQQQTLGVLSLIFSKERTMKI